MREGPLLSGCIKFVQREPLLRTYNETPMKPRFEKLRPCCLWYLKKKSYGTMTPRILQKSLTEYFLSK